MNKLKEIQKKLLIMYIDFFQICEKKSIKLIAAYGTLLGAIRHKGFIPWDDDLDFFIYEKDENDFMKIFLEEKRYKIIHGEKEKRFPWIMIRVYDLESNLMPLHKSKNDLFPNKGWIDIFILRHVKEKHKNKKYRAHSRMGELLYWKNIEPVAPAKIWKILLKISLFPIPRWLLLKMHLKFMKNFFSKKNTSLNSTFGIDREPIQSASLHNELVKYKFENTFVWGPKDYETVLQATYSNWKISDNGASHSLHYVGKNGK